MAIADKSGENEQNGQATVAFNANEFEILDESTSDQFKLTMPMNFFQKNDWNVEVTKNGLLLLVTAQRNEDGDKRTFQRKFQLKKALPYKVDTASVEASFTDSGYLVITAFIRGDNI